jgi:hypothetical protein
MLKLISQMSTGISLINQLFSKKASASIELVAYRGCGAPCLTKAGVGDVSEQQFGITKSSFWAAALDAGVKALLGLIEQSDIALRCRRTAERHFELGEGVKRYALDYLSLYVSRGQP